MATTDGAHIWPPRAADPRIIELLDGATRTADIATDVRLALASRLSLTAAQANAHSVDDLWYRFLISESLGSKTHEPFSPDFTTGVPDDDFASVSFLSGFEGIDESTTIVDEGPVGHTGITANANAQLDTAQKKFGDSSLLLDGTGDNVTIDDHASLTLAAGDFTIEAHVRFNGDPGTDPRTIVSKWTEGTNQREWWLQTQDNVLQFYISTNGSGLALKASSSFNPAADTWYHIAVCRTGGLAYFFVDGVAHGNAGLTETIFDGSSPVIIGSSIGSFPNYANGWVDELRITKGVARYTTGFTPPDAAYPRTGP